MDIDIAIRYKGQVFRITRGVPCLACSLYAPTDCLTMSFCKKIRELLGDDLAWELVWKSKDNTVAALVQYEGKLYEASFDKQWESCCDDCEARGKDFCIDISASKDQGALCVILGSLTGKHKVYFKEVS